MSRLCKYRHILGVEKEGVHSYRLFDIAVVDLGLTIWAAWVASSLLETKFSTAFLSLMLLGMLLHWVFCVHSTINMKIAKLWHRIHFWNAYRRHVE